MTEVDRAAVVRLFSDVEALRRGLRLYPPSHPALQPARARVRERALALAGGSGVVTASFGPDRLFWAGEEIVLGPATPAARLAYLLFHLGLAAVHLSFPQAADGLVELTDRLATLHDPPGEADRAGLLGATAPAGVELVPFDLSGVQLLDSEDARGARGGRPVWAELARRLSRDGAFATAGRINQGELAPGAAAEALAAARDPETLFDHLFIQLAEIGRSGDLPGRPALLAEVREFFAELIRLLDPDRRVLAVVTGLRHLPLANPDDPWVAGELMLDAVERMLLTGVTVPEVVQRALHRMAAPLSEQPDGVPEDLAVRARHLLARLPVAAPEAGGPAPPEVSATAEPEGTPCGRELTAELGEERLRPHLVRLLQEAIMLWPDTAIAERAAVRLAEEFAAALDAGHLETAVRLAPLLGSIRNPAAHRAIAENGVPAAVRAFRTLEKRHHPDLTAALSALGEPALPAVLEALADEDSLAVRKRLLEVVARQGARALPYVQPLLDDPRWYVVRNAVFLLRRIGGPNVSGLLKSHVEGAPPKVLVELLKALVELQDPDWFKLLVQCMDSDDDSRRQVAIDVASRIRHPDVVGALVKRLQESIGGRLREASSLDLIRALGRLRDPAALGVLQEIVALKQWRYPFSLTQPRREAAAAIARLEGADARRLASALVRSRDADVAEAARAVLRDPRDPRDPREPGEDGE
ncbi:MAG: HEAT repeat domain-containing protein [Thermoanaerobaculaceae bacterium]|nr:HEAT repeat domain-containing protein [Thermoanaerobaculaceae bacterium]